MATTGGLPFVFRNARVLSECLLAATLSLFVVRITISMVSLPLVAILVSDYTAFDMLENVNCHQLQSTSRSTRWGAYDHDIWLSLLTFLFDVYFMPFPRCLVPIVYSSRSLTSWILMHVLNKCQPSAMINVGSLFREALYPQDRVDTVESPFFKFNRRELNIELSTSALMCSDSGRQVHLH